MFAFNNFTCRFVPILAGESVWPFGLQNISKPLFPKMHGCQSDPKSIYCESSIYLELWKTWHFWRGMMVCQQCHEVTFFLSLIPLVELVCLAYNKWLLLWSSPWIRLETMNDDCYLEDIFILISLAFRDGTVPLSREPSICLCLSVGSQICLCFPARKCVEIASGCLQRGGCVETHCWDTSWVNINCASFDLQCCPQDGP